MNTIARSRDLWSNLPVELLTIISDCLNTRVDSLRLRAVCSSWRSSIPIYNNTSLHLPMELPYLYGGFLQPFRITSTLTEATLYRIEPLDHDKFDSNGIGGWLIKAKEVNPNEFCLLYVDASKVLFPLNLNLLDFDASKILLPMNFNLLDYRVFELGKSYVLNECVKHWKTIFSAEHKSLLAILHGRLYLFRLGDEKWTNSVHRDYKDVKDIIMYLSEFHAIDAFGKLVSINASNLNITQISNPFDAPVSDANLMHLLQGFGNLYVVVRPLNKDMEAMCYDMELNQYIYSGGRYVENLHAFKIYKLNEEGKDWVKVDTLGNKVIILSGDDSVLASTEEVAGLRGNCIYFADQDYYYEMFEKKFALFQGLGLFHGQ